MHVLVGPNPMGLEKHLPALRDAYPEVTFSYCPNQADLPREIADADIYWGWLSRELFLAAARLKWMQSPSSGVDRFLAIPELAQGEVILTSAVGTHAGCLGDSVMGMILAHTRGIVASALMKREHRWAGRDVRSHLVELTGATMGIIGLGNVGRAVAKRAKAFDMRIIAVDRFSNAKPDDVAWLHGLEALPELLAESDYVVVAVPYTHETSNLLGTEEFAQMKPGAFLVGISRGGIIVEAALAQALKSGHLSGAALDVFSEEPLPQTSELWDLPNLIITPHIAGGTQYESQHLAEIFGENLGRFLRGEFPLRNQVDKKRGF